MGQRMELLPRCTGVLSEPARASPCGRWRALSCGCTKVSPSLRVVQSSLYVHGWTVCSECMDAYELLAPIHRTRISLCWYGFFCYTTATSGLCRGCMSSITVVSGVFQHPVFIVHPVSMLKHTLMCSWRISSVRPLRLIQTNRISEF